MKAKTKQRAQADIENTLKLLAGFSIKDLKVHSFILNLFYDSIVETRSRCFKTFLCPTQPSLKFILLINV